MKFITLFNYLPNLVKTKNGIYCLNICFTGNDYWVVSYINGINHDKFSISVFINNEKAIKETFFLLTQFIEEKL